MNQNNPKIILLIIVSIAVLAGIGVTTLCLSLFLHTYADPAILTAIITITSGLIGALTSMLTNTGTKPETGGGQSGPGGLSGQPGEHPGVQAFALHQAHQFSAEEPPYPKPEPAEPAS